MGLEKISAPGSNNKEEKRVGLYPERPFVRVGRDMDRLRKIESGEIKKIELSEEEKKEVLDFENELGERLESIDDIKINTALFYSEYFRTTEGRAEFKKVVGFDIEGETDSDIQKFLLRNRNSIDQVEGKTLSVLTGKSKTFNDLKMVDALKQGLSIEGDLDIKGILNPQRAYFLLNPDMALAKIQKLREFKKIVALNKQDNPHETKEIKSAEIAKEKIRGLYRNKTNTMIASEASMGAAAFRLGELIGDDELTESEIKLKNMFPGMQTFRRTLARYDSFVNGATTEYDDKGMRRQLGKELESYLSTVENKYLAGEIEREQCIKDKGLDPKKIDSENIECETFSKWADYLFDSYGEKSIHTEESFDPKRDGPAPDGKWQFIARDAYKSMSVNSKQKVIKSGVKVKSITEALGTLLGHEFTHFIQAINRTKMPLHLFEKIGTDRIGVFSEGGAMMVESLVTKDFFGYETNPHPHYVRAMKKRLEGGTYLECVKAFYDSELRNLKRKKEAGILDEKSFADETEYWLKMALDRTKRLFQGNEDFSQGGDYLSNSGNTVYAEQVIVMENLRKNGMEKYAFVKGCNLGALATIAEMGLLDLGEIQKPNLEPLREIWEQEKGKYLLDEKISDEQSKIRELRDAINSLD